MRWSSLLIVWLLVGCNGEGDGGTDVAKEDAQTQDVAGADLGQPDTKTPDVVPDGGRQTGEVANEVSQLEVDVAPDLCVPECGEKVCGDDGCGGSCGECEGEGEECQEGECVVPCIPDCEGKQCGDGGCGWSCGTCVGPYTCVDHQCLELGEASECAAVILCRAECGEDEPCKQKCYDDADQAAQEAFDAVTGCATEKCQDLSATPATVQLCIVDICAPEWETCMGGWGYLSCQGMLACIGNCGGPGECEWTCLTAGTKEGQSVFWALQSCIQLNCAEECGTDTDCMQKCAQTHCVSLALQCQMQ